MKKVLPVLLLVSLLLCACGSGAGTPSAQHAAETSNPANLQESPAAPISEPTPEPVEIYDAFTQLGSYTDELGNTWDYVLRIPAIKTSGTDATRLNQELYSALYPSVKDALDAMAGSYSLAVCRVDYTVSVNGDLVSILAEIDTDWGFESYYTVNFDARSKTEISHAELLYRFGLTEDAFLSLAPSLVDELYQSYYAGAPQDEFWQQQYDRSVAPENFTQDCQLFVNDDGQLCMIFRLYSLAGGDYYYHILPFSG